MYIIQKSSIIRAFFMILLYMPCFALETGKDVFVQVMQSTSPGSELQRLFEKFREKTEALKSQFSHIVQGEQAPAAFWSYFRSVRTSPVELNQIKEDAHVLNTYANALWQKMNEIELNEQKNNKNSLYLGTLQLDSNRTYIKGLKEFLVKNSLISPSS